jgi:hypothetical protein
VPSDRLATFDPQLIVKYRRRLPGFDDKIVSMYARGMTVREIQGHLAELYGIDVSPDLISAVTDAILGPSTSPLASVATAARKSRAFASSRPRAPNSGCG